MKQWWKEFGWQYYPPMGTWFDGNLVQCQKPQTLEMKLVDSLNRLVIEQMWSLLLKMESDFMEMIEVNDSRQVEHNKSVMDDDNCNDW